MLRIAIADDEERIRLGLAKLIRSASPDYIVEGIYSNGAELLQHVERHGADLVMTDIRMPVMNGLEFAERLQGSHPNVRCVIISGYHDFEYARAALRYKVSDYLIKPVDKAELYRLLHEMDTAINGERQRLLQEQRRALELILSGGESPERTENQWDTDAVWYAIRSDRPIDLAIAEAVLQEEAIPYVGTVRLRDGLYGLLVQLKGSDPLVAESESIGSHLLHRLSREASVSIGASMPFRGADRIKASFEEAEAAARRAMYRFENVALILSGASASRNERSASASAKDGMKELEPSLIHALQIVDIDQLEKWITGLFQGFQRVEEPFESMLEILDRVLYLAKREIREFTELADEAFGSGQLWKSTLADYYKFEPMSRWYSERLMSVLRQVREGRSGSVRAVDEVKAWLSKSYKEELDLGKLAEQVYLTPSYLSKLFKQETGMTITDYAIKVRIEEAKELLRSRHDLKTYEVGERVGYPDSAYFAKIFKKTVGITPNEYRNLVR
jgi:two-component system, response regulator YesN